jgi:Protein of unknown function (DUF2806)
MSKKKIKKSQTDLTANFSAVNFDLGALGELKGVLNNLINTIGRGCGRLYAPLEQARLAKVENQVALERAEHTIEMIRKLGELAKVVATTGEQLGQQGNAILERALDRFVGDLERKQANREDMARDMMLALADRPPSQDTELVIELDWVDDFFQITENIGNPDIRAFWAKLLAKEVTKPGSICRQTLHVLRIVSPKVAQKFSHFCRTSMAADNSCFFYHPHVHAFQTGGPLNEFGISFDDLLDFESSGLIRSAETLMVSHGNEEEKWYEIDLGGKLAEVKWAGIQAHSIFFTIAGRDIRNALPLEPLEEYAEALRKSYGGKLAFRWKE